MEIAFRNFVVSTHNQHKPWPNAQPESRLNSRGKPGASRRKAGDAGRGDTGAA